MERHKVRVQAPADVTLAAAREQDLQRSAIVRAIFRAREVALGARHDDSAVTPLMTQLLTLGWGVLEDVPGREVVVGAVTRPWEAEVVFQLASAGAVRLVL